MLDGRPYEITDMRSRPEGGRVIHLARHPPHSMTSLESVPVYTVAPAIQSGRHEEIPTGPERASAPTPAA
ncbi:hypothetical protein ABH941_007399 [Streptacidiphilus sp. EB103A]